MSAQRHFAAIIAVEIIIALLHTSLYDHPSDEQLDCPTHWFTMGERLAVFRLLSLPYLSRTQNRDGSRQRDRNIIQHVQLFGKSNIL